MTTPDTRILIACHPQMTDTIRKQLATTGKPLCHCVTSRYEFLDALQQPAWHIVISELEVNDLTALDAFRLCRQHGFDIPFILLTETGAEKRALQCLEAGIDQYVAPTVQGFRRLPALVHMLLERSELGRRRQLVEKELNERRERYQDIFDNTSDLIQCLAADGSFLYTNRAWRDTMGYSEEEVASLTLADVLHPDSAACCQDRFKRLKAGDELIHINFKFVTREGKTVHLAGDCGSIIKDGEAISTRGIFKNITETVKAEEALRISEARYQALYENAPDIYTIISPAGTILSINRIGARILGYDVGELVGKSAEQVIHPDDLAAVIAHIGRQFENPGHSSDIEYRKVRKDGTAIWVHQRSILDPQSQEPRLLVVCRDVTDRRRLEVQLSYQATHDALTDLINRREFENRLHRLLLSAESQPAEHVLCYLDLDQFKIVNDTCGHVAGDELLRQLSSLMTGQVRARDTLARLGGDEFAILMEYCPVDKAAALAEHVREAIGNFHFQWHERRFSLGVSIGLVPLQGITSLKDAMGLADAACYTAKGKGRNRIHIYHPDDQAVAGEVGGAHWASTITTALESDSFMLYAQPVHPCAATASDSRYEILLRLRDKGEIVRPGDFMPAAERYNLSPKLDRWVIDHVIDWLAEHEDILAHTEQCSINLSALSLCDEAFRHYLLERLSSARFPNSKLCFEVTETAAISNLKQATGFIDAVRATGCYFALDDFGSGLSSYAYLRNLPVDIVKIDGTFVRNIATNDIDRMMVKSICEIVKLMGKQTTAEYVEDAAAFSVLQAIGVDFVQGYHLGRPVSLDRIATDILQPPDNLVCIK
ncbi:MAG TPA: bifunctional diguanylate cyclase/phosphodiesterase [Gammaproteobacteria bacterium]|nr:bifunctional diguanylate cyclase/phosphodiesterase [Gammaproteobacteria bacterium]